MLNDAALTVAANAVIGVITHLQAHSAAPTNGVGSEMGSRQAVTEAVDADGDITFTQNFTGLTASTAFWGVSYWSAATAGTNYGQLARSAGDTTTNSLGEYSFTGAENSTAT